MLVRGGPAARADQADASFMRLGWLAAAWFSVIVGSVLAINQIGRDWAIDGGHNLEVARRLLAGQPLYDGWYLYPPTAALITAPATLLPEELALWLWLVAKVGLVVGGTIWLTRGWSWPARVGAAAVAVTSLGVIHDMALGNTNVIILAAVALAAFGPQRVAAGIPLGLALATFPKPLLVPIVIWLIVTRRPVAVGVIGTALATTAVAVPVVGSATYLDFFRALDDGQRFAGPFQGNIGLSATSTGWMAVAMAFGAIASTYAVLRRNAQISLGVAIAAGPMVSPYIGIYSAAPLLIALFVLANHHPRRALAAVAVAPVAIVANLTLFAAMIAVALIAPGPDVVAAWLRRSIDGAGEMSSSALRVATGWLPSRLATRTASRPVSSRPVGEAPRP